MRQYVIWLIFLQLCGSEYVDYSDYHPKNIPLDNLPSLQAENPSSEYKTVMKSLCDNWQSPISYLKKRGYIPTSSEMENKNSDSAQLKKSGNKKLSSLKNENYFFFPGENEQESVKGNDLAMEDGDNPEPEPPSTEPPPPPDSSGAAVSGNDSGIIDKVRDKFFSIFAHKDDNTNNKDSRNNLFDSNYDFEDPEFLDDSDDYDGSDRRIFVRSATDKPAKTPLPECTTEDLLSNLSDTELQYIRTFINCFKQSKKGFQLQPVPGVDTTTLKPCDGNETSEGATTPKSSTNTTTTKPGSDSKNGMGAKANDTTPSEAKPGDIKPSEAKPVDTKPSESKSNDSKSSESKPDDGTPGETKPSDAKPGEAKPNGAKAPDSKTGDGTQADAKTGDAKPGDAKPGDTKPGDTKPGATKLSNVPKPNGAKPNGPRPNGTKPNGAKPGSAKPSQNATEAKMPPNMLPECIPPVDPSKTPTLPPPPTTSTTTTTTTECIPDGKPMTSTTTAAPKTTVSPLAKSGPDDFTVDLDINQKNGTGEDFHLVEKCTCLPNALTSSTSPPPSCPDNKSKYITKSMFLAHLHHMVDEVGKPPHKPIDLTKIQDIIDKSKKPINQLNPLNPPVIMADSKSTECAPLRLNDMSFDLEWNKIENTPEKDRDKLNILDYPHSNQQPQGQSLAAKFLQDVNSYPHNNEEYLNTPYGDNFLDSQQTLPDNLELPLKMSTKREAVLPSSASHSHKLSKLLSDIASLPDSGGEEDYYPDDDDDDAGQASRRRIKGRMKVRGKKKSKTKFRPNASEKGAPDTANVDVISQDSDDPNLETGNDFNNFNELRDIQFRVNDDDEQAISTFISNLNSPPEVFSFDVDKYLRSAQMDMEPREPEFEIQSPEPRTFYEFMEAPAIEKERLPMIDAPAETEEEEPVVEKRARTSVGKRDLLRQYIKGVSSALHHNLPELTVEYRKANEVKAQRSPNLDSDISFRTNNLIDGFSSSLDAMNYIKSNDHDDFLDNFYLLNDGSSQIYDLGSQDPDITPNDKFSPQSLEIDLELDKKFRDLGIGAYNGGERAHHNAASEEDVKSVDDGAEGNRQAERRDFESIND